MRKRKDYATRLTKEELIEGGITCMTKDGLAFRGEKQAALSVNNQGYIMLNIYELDEDGNKIKVPIKRLYKGCKNISNTYMYKTRVIGLHRAMWAWFHDEVPAGYVVDHINNQHTELEDYNLDNLQLLTPAQNLEKERGISTRMIKCMLSKPLSFYEDKLDKYLAEYEQAKKDHNAKKIKNLGNNIAYTRARIRYYKENLDSANQIKAKLDTDTSEKKEYHEVAKMKKAVKEWSKSLDWYQGKEIRKFIRLFQKDRDLETLKQLYNIVIAKKENK